MSDTEDLQAPDEFRPVKRARLEGSLAVTGSTKEEVMEEEDWDDIYGGPDGLAGTTPSGNVAHTNPNAQTQSNGCAASNLAAPPAVTDEHVTDVANADALNKLDDGVPAEAISQGDDIVAPGPAVDGLDAGSAKVLEETSRIEVGEPNLHPPEQNIPSDGAGTKVAADGDGQPAYMQERGDAADNDVMMTSIQSKPTGDPEFMAAAAAQRGDQNAEWQFDSSDAESSSDTDTSDSDDSSDDADSDSDGGYEMLDPATAARILMSGDGEDDDGENGRGKSGTAHQPRTANEVAETAVPKPDVTITTDMKITLLGSIERTVENMALIKGATPGEYQVLESGSVLCNENREVIGAVAETFGRVQEPMYSVAFASDKEVEEAGITFGTKIYYVDSHSTFVFTQPLKNLKGTDASNIHDEEVGEDEIEFSDDEKEAEYKRQKKLAKKIGRAVLSRSAFNKTDSGHSGTLNHSGGKSYSKGGNDMPSQSYGGGMSYDDNDEATEEFYQPLKRPENLSQMMAGAPPPRSHQAFDRGRGRGRGDRGRGRGDRNRGRGGSDNRGHGQRGGRGGPHGHQTQPSGHKGSAQSFPDHHNTQSNNRPRHSLPSRPDSQQATLSNVSPSVSGHVNVPQPQYSQQPQSYQFNGYTFQYGAQPPTAAPPGYAPPQTFYPNQQHPQQPPAGSMPVGAFVNPAFFQQQSQQAAYGAWGAPAQQQQQQQQQQQMQQELHPATAQQQADLADILRSLRGQQMR